MTRNKYYMSACMALYDKILKSTTDIIKQVNGTCESMEKETKDPKLLNDRIMNINANAYTIISYLLSENKMLRVIASYTSKIPSDTISEDIQWQLSDLVDGDFFKKFYSHIKSEDIKIPKVVIFEELRQPIFDILSHMVNFVLYLTYTSLEEDISDDEVVKIINDKIMEHMSVYDEIGLVIMSDSKSDTRKPLVLKFTEESEEDDYDEEFDDDEKDSIIMANGEPKFLN